MVHQVIRFNNEGFRLWKSEFDSKEESYRKMGLTESPKILSSDEGKDDVAVVLTWNNMKNARQYVTKANFTKLEDEGKHEESLRDYMSQSQLKVLSDEGLKSLTRQRTTYSEASGVRDSEEGLRGTVRASGVRDSEEGMRGTVRASGYRDSEEGLRGTVRASGYRDSEEGLRGTVRAAGVRDSEEGMRGTVRADGYRDSNVRVAYFD
ncbi:MAG: hypothetical protein ACC656_08440 [Candidatus Heimdallarchaeota archaeon]